MNTTKRTLIGLAALGAIALGGSAIAGATTTTPSTSTTGTTARPMPALPANMPAQPANMPAHGTAKHEGSEKAISGEDAAKAQAAAVKAAGGGTAGPVTTNFTGDGYEVTVKKTDGSTAEIHLDNSFNARLGPGGHDAPGAPDPAGPSA